MRIRGYELGDVEAMYRLDLVCFETPFQFDRAMMLEAVEMRHAIVVVAADEAGIVLGFIIVHAEGTGAGAFGYIVTIDVAPAECRAGVGSAMLQEAEAQARLAGLASMGLHVAINNVGAIAFYERQHYEQMGRVKRFYQEAKQDALVYTKVL